MALGKELDRGWRLELVDDLLLEHLNDKIEAEGDLAVVRELESGDNVCQPFQILVPIHCEHDGHLLDRLGVPIALEEDEVGDEHDPPIDD